MLYILVHSLLLFFSLALVWQLFRKESRAWTLKAYISEIREFPNSWQKPLSFSCFLSYLLFLSLPLTLGLFFYLKSDANVLVVILWIVWTYNWFKYTFWKE